MKPSSPLHRGLFRGAALLLFAGYVAIMAPLFRQDLQLATFGDTLGLKLRDVDAQLEQNDREIQLARKRREDIGYLKDERRILGAQGQQATREIRDWEALKTLWGGVYWSAFALAHAVVLPIGFWMFAAGSGPAAGPRSVATTRKRTPRPSRNRPPKLVEGTNT